MKKGPENPQLLYLARMLSKAASKNKARVWKRVAELLQKPRRRKSGVNLFQLQRHCKEGESIVVPEKLLSQGKLSKKISVAAVSHSKAVEKKFIESGSKLLSIKQLVEQNPEGKGVRIIVG